MKANNKAMLYEAVSEFIQLHAFDHLLDNELAQLKSLLNVYTLSEEGNETHEITNKLIPLLSKVNFLAEFNPHRKEMRKLERSKGRDLNRTNNSKDQA